MQQNLARAHWYDSPRKSLAAKSAARRTGGPELSDTRFENPRDLVQACIAGDDAAWRELVRRYGRLISSIAASYSLSQADIDDVFQTVLTRCFESLQTITDQSKLAAWLITTTHRECWRIGRTSRRYGDFEESLKNRPIESTDPLLEWEQQHYVNEALTALGGRCEELLRALYLDPVEPDYRAIAQRLGMNPNSVGATRSRCFEKLERILADMGFFGPGENPNEGGTKSPRDRSAE